MAGSASARRAGGRGAQRSENALPPLLVRYMRRMKRNRVYAYEVSFQGGRKRTRRHG